MGIMQTWEWNNEEGQREKTKEGSEKQRRKAVRNY